MDLFSSLLLDPPGSYSLTPYGASSLVVLKGSPLFIQRGYDLFISMGGESKRNERYETPLPGLHYTDEVDTVYFGLPAPRIRIALALYFYAQLWRANTRDLVDDEGDYLDTVCDCEAALWDQAEQAACDFIVCHMPPNWRVLPEYGVKAAVVEHGFGSLDTTQDD